MQFNRKRLGLIGTYERIVFNKWSYYGSLCDNRKLICYMETKVKAAIDQVWGKSV